MLLKRILKYEEWTNLLFATTLFRILSKKNWFAATNFRDDKIAARNIREDESLANLAKTSRTWINVQH